jgi:hypothetical protein
MAVSNSTTGGMLENHLLSLLAPMLTSFAGNSYHTTSGLLKAIRVRNFNGVDDLPDLIRRFTEDMPVGILAVPNPDYASETQVPGSQLCAVNKELNYVFIAGTNNVKSEDEDREFYYATHERFEELLHGRDILASMQAASLELPRDFEPGFVKFTQGSTFEIPNISAWGQGFSITLRGHVRRSTW